MKVNFNRELKQLDGKPLKQANENGVKEVVTLKKLCANAVLAEKEEDKLSYNKKAERFDLAMKIQNSKGAIDIPSEDITMIKKSLEIWPPLFSGQAVRMIEKVK